MSQPIFLRNVAVEQKSTTNVLIKNGIIAAMDNNITTEADAETIDCNGALLLPSFVDAHVHLDKTRINGPRLSHPVTASVSERAANERLLRKELKHDPYIFGSNLVRQLSRMGTTHIRSHIDVDPDTGLDHVEACLRIREKFKGVMDIQLVAFPQSGILASPGVRDLMDKALGMGVDLVGGLDPEAFDKNREGHLDSVFSLAEKHGKGIDLHLHEPGEMGLLSLKSVVARVKKIGMKNAVTISHGYALGQVSAKDRDELLAEMAELGISVATSAPGAVAFPPVEALLDAGIVYAGVSDNIQDMWSPWGTGDQLERAMFLAYRHNFRADAPILRCFDMVTENGAKILGMPEHGRHTLRVGAAANLTAVMAEDIPTAVLQRPHRLFTIKAGKIVFNATQLTSSAS